MTAINASSQLKDLVRSVRACKTANEERTLVARECAALRDSFKTENNEKRCVSVTKLLYFYILGYPAHFGQMECLKLIASSRFVDKRVGYLGCMMMLDELADIHVLVTNCLKNDLSHTSQHVQGLALCTLASICSSDMAQMLASEVEIIIKKSSSYLKKKATLCASRLVTKAPETAPLFIPYLGTLLNSKNVGIRLCGCTLAIVMCQINPSVVVTLKSLDVLPSLIKVLKSLINAGSAPEHTVHGIGNPFLQVKILRLFSLLGHNDETVSTSLSEVLAQAITNTEVKKNAGNAIIYEAAVTIFNIKSNKDLKVLAINLLGKLLQSNDKNSKYVALSTMLKVAQYDIIPLLRHRAYILKCTSDEDISIKKRAVELLFELITKENVVETIQHLISCIPQCNSTLKQFITSTIITTLEKHDLDKKWQVQTFLDILESATLHVQDHAVSNFVCMISNCPQIQPFAVTTLLDLLKKGNIQPIISSVACWCIGEYGSELYNNQQFDSQAIDMKSAVDLITKELRSHSSLASTKCIAIYSLAKIASRISSLKSLVVPIINSYATYIDPEIQQRSIEFFTMAQSSNSFCEAIFEAMPPLTVKSIPSTHLSASELEEPQPQISSKNEEKKEESLLDLLIGTGFNDSLKPNTPSNSTESNNVFMHKIEIYSKNGVLAFLEFSNPLPAGILGMTFRAKNSNLFPVSEFSMQIAVPKTLSVNVSAPSGTAILPSFTNELTQSFVITNTNKIPIKLRLKLSYTIQGASQSEIVEVTNLPALVFP